MVAASYSRTSLPSSFDYRGFRIVYERQQGPGADWQFHAAGWDGDPSDRSPRGHNATAGECIEQIDEWYADNAPAVSVTGAIAEHRAAVMVDEASFTDDCKPISEALAVRTEAAEIAAFQAFVAAPCACQGDVNAKVQYLLHGTVGQRDKLLDCLSDERYSPDCQCLADRFLRSLVVPVAEPTL